MAANQTGCDVDKPVARKYKKRLVQVVNAVFHTKNGDTQKEEGPLDEKTKAALHKIAKELLSTEETYVSVLHLLDQVFYKRLLRLSNESDEVPKTVIDTIFQHLSAIYLFHSNCLLPRLKERIDEWDSNPQIGDIMTLVGPFLKMYDLYAENLDKSQETVNTWLKKSTEVSKVIKEIHELPECKSIPLQEHMLVPVQRIPRYEMLLKDFAKKLPEASPMRDDVETVLQVIFIASNHSNELMEATHVHQTLPVRIDNIEQDHNEWRNNEAVKPATPSMKPKVPPKPKPFQVQQNLGNEVIVEGSLDEKTKAALYKIAKELLSTEETYVSVLHLLDQVFYQRLLRLSDESEKVPKTVIDTIFQHLSAIYLFHSNCLLPRLKERIDEWDSNPQIGDIMILAAPFLKMYGLYVKNLDKSREIINTWLEKSTEFSKVIKEIQELPECKSLPLQEHMLVPVQRIPRYEMLLKDFAKKLPEASPMRDDIDTALQLIIMAANHSNEFMKATEKSLNLVKVYNNLACNDFDTDDMKRTLIKEGTVTKVAARDGKEYNRYLYLFSDMLLFCKECDAFQKLQGKNHKIMERIDLVGMTTASIDNEFHPNVFCVHGVQKSIEFSCSTQEEKDDWLNAINKAIKKRIENENSFRRMSNVSSSSKFFRFSRTSVDLQNFTNQETNLLEVPVIQNPNFITLSEKELGTRAPHWIKYQDATMCMRCSADFHFFRRRHHCRACGWVVCSGCSNNKIALLYDSTSSLSKVCDVCFSILSKEEESNSSDEFEENTQSDGIGLYGDNILADTFHYAEDKSWINLWCIIPSDEPLIYCYKARRDIKAHLIVNLPGSQVTLGTEGDYKYFIKIYDSVGSLNVLATDEEEVAIKWTELITQIIMGHEERDTSSHEENVEEDVPSKT